MPSPRPVAPDALRGSQDDAPAVPRTVRDAPRSRVAGVATSHLSRAVVSGSVAAATSTTALAILAVRAGNSAVQPLNATSHWLHGPGAAKVRRVDLAHTGVGTATHHTATIFWAAFFEAWAGVRPAAERHQFVTRALTVAALAAAVDYTITPKRFTPGWEYVLSKRAMGLVYVAMAAGFAATALARASGEPR